MRIERQLLAAARAGGLIHAGDHVLVAVSGGSDSVALLRALHRLAPALHCRLTVAHLDHGIRGADARADARFVRALARELGVPCIAGRADVPALARRQGLSLEMAARAARHAFFRRAARRVSATCVATAHTADDQAETVLLRLARGAGLQGLAAMAPQRDIDGLRIIRPMLGLRRESARAWLRTLGQAWCEDASNLEPFCPRNRLRNDVLPLLAGALNPALVETLCDTATRLREDAEWMDAAARTLLAAARRERSTPDAQRSTFNAQRSRRGKSGRTELESGDLLPHPAALRRRVLALWLRECGVPEDRIDDARLRSADRALSAGRGRAQVELGADLALTVDGGRLRIERAAIQEAHGRGAFCATLAVPGVTDLPQAGLRVTVAAAAGFRKPPNGPVASLPAWTYLRAAAVGRQPLRVRSWQPGDRMAPLGMTGTRKLQDIFVDAKVPAGQRSGTPVLECGGVIVWVPGYRVARGFEVRGPQEPSLRIRVVSAPRGRPSKA
jgi:tRNA(Ile)-lysidine synthase